MALNQVTTTEEGMLASANEISAKVTQFIGSLGNINDLMAALQGTWKGSASLKFSTAMDNWETSFRQIIDQLNLLLEAMGQNTTVYRNTEEANANIAGSFATALPNF